jgi:hypothetical protein
MLPSISYVILRYYHIISPLLCYLLSRISYYDTITSPPSTMLPSISYVILNKPIFGLRRRLDVVRLHKTLFLLAEISAKVAMASHFLGLVGTLPPGEEHLWFPNQNFQDPDTWTL